LSAFETRTPVRFGGERTKVRGHRKIINVELTLTLPSPYKGEGDPNAQTTMNFQRSL
jgi:hypothetical protein